MVDKKLTVKIVVDFWFADPSHVLIMNKMLTREPKAVEAYFDMRRKIANNCRRAGARLVGSEYGIISQAVIAWRAEHPDQVWHQEAA